MVGDIESARIPTIGTKEALNGTYLYMMIGKSHHRGSFTESPSATQLTRSYRS
jgi:hypothetical protein